MEELATTSEVTAAPETNVVIDPTGTSTPIVEVAPKPIICGRCSKPKGETHESCNCGRPVIYSEAILKLADEYLASCKDVEKEVVKQINEDKGYEMYDHKLVVKIPTKGGLARHLGVSRETLYAWAKEYKEFSDIMEALGAEQEEKLINNGLSGDYNPTISKLLLSKHGYNEKLEQEITNPDGNLKTIIINKHGSNDKSTSEANGGVGSVGE